MNLAEIAQKAIHQNGSNGDPVLSSKDLQKVIELLCSLPLDQRRKVPGMNPERADIIIAGAAILDTFMKELGLDSIMTTGRGLQDGLLVDYLSRMDAFPLLGELSPRQRSVLQLGRSCGINEVHARTVTSLVLELFDSAKEQGLHNFSDNERELLEYATFLHDIGSFISYYEPPCPFLLYYKKFRTAGVRPERDYVHGQHCPFPPEKGPEEEGSWRLWNWSPASGTHCGS